MILCSKLQGIPIVTIYSYWSNELNNGLCKIVTKSQVVTIFNVTKSRLHFSMYEVFLNKNKIEEAPDVSGPITASTKSTRKKHATFRISKII